MGGALNPGPFPNPAGRRGNITLHAEFNAIQDSFALERILKSGMPITFVTMDATQRLYQTFNLLSKIEQMTRLTLAPKWRK